MNEKAVETAQNFLTVDYGYNVHKLVDLSMIMHRHTPENVIIFLEKLISDYDRNLKRRILNDKTDPRINDIVARRFRVKMAYRTLQNSMSKKAA